MFSGRSRLACRLGRRFGFAEVPTGDPRPGAGQPDVVIFGDAICSGGEYVGWAFSVPAAYPSQANRQGRSDRNKHIRIPDPYSVGRIPALRSARRQRSAVLPKNNEARLDLVVSTVLYSSASSGTPESDAKDFRLYSTNTSVIPSFSIMFSTRSLLRYLRSTTVIASYSPMR